MGVYIPNTHDRCRIGGCIPEHRVRPSLLLTDDTGLRARHHWYKVMQPWIGQDIQSLVKVLDIRPLRVGEQECSHLLIWDTNLQQFSIHDLSCMFLLGLPFDFIFNLLRQEWFHVLGLWQEVPEDVVTGALAIGTWVRYDRSTSWSLTDHVLWIHHGLSPFLMSPQLLLHIRDTFHI